MAPHCVVVRFCSTPFAKKKSENQRGTSIEAQIVAQTSYIHPRRGAWRHALCVAPWCRGCVFVHPFHFLLGLRHYVQFTRKLRNISFFVESHRSTQGSEPEHVRILLLSLAEASQAGSRTDLNLHLLTEKPHLASALTM